MRKRPWQVTSPMDGFVRRLANVSVSRWSLGRPSTMIGKPFVKSLSGPGTLRAAAGSPYLTAAYGTAGFAAELEPGPHWVMAFQVPPDGAVTSWTQ